MNNTIENIILGVIANGLTSLIAYIGRGGIKILKHEENLRQLLEKDAALATILQKATVSVAKTLRLDNKSQTEKLRFFLASPDIDSIVRQIYASQLTSTKNGNHLRSIQTEFLACLAIHLREPQQGLEDLAEKIFDSLLKGCESALSMAIDKGVLSAHEAKSAFRYRILLDELAAIQKNIVFLTERQKIDIGAILKFEEQYRQQVANRHGHIIPPHFDVVRKLPIDELYVSPSFITTPRKKEDEPNALKVSDFLSVIYRAVLLGNPGSGKSTFASKLCYDLATRYSKRLFARRQVTPIILVLRDYGAEKKARNCSILQFIETTANSKYQVLPPPGAIEYLLLNGHAIVIFDGLDELLETSYRQEISSDVESFCNLYPAVPALVTSRVVGYEQAPLDEKKFEIFRLAPFDEHQVQEYVTKWFSTDMDLTREQQRQKSQAFLEESQIVPDLRSNPLMLALMCNIYRGENYIPRNRPDVYEKCAVMLFERWDKSRGIHIPLPFEAHISPAMMYLAHWVYTSETLQGGVTEKKLIAKATEYLCPRRFEDPDEAERAASEFIEFCRGRAWVFTDTGTTKAGERLYQFTHRTFLEYFAAAHLVRTHPTPKMLGGFLLPKIVKREWDVVAQLAFQLQNKNVEGAGDELLTDLFTRTGKRDEEWNLLSFAARCLEFIVPSPKVTREITTACIEASLTWGSEQVTEEKYSKHGRAHPKYNENPPGILGDLLYVALENRVTMMNTLEKLLVERINKGNEPETLLALEIGLHLDNSLHLIEGRRPQREAYDLCHSVSNRIFDACSTQVHALCPKYFGPCLEGFRRGLISATNFVDWHGIEGLFKGYHYSMFPDTMSLSIAESLLDVVTSAPYSLEWKRYLPNYIHHLEEISRIFFSSHQPWVKGKQVTPAGFPGFAEWIFENRPERQMEAFTLGSNACFGIFVLLATILEARLEASVSKEIPKKAEPRELASIKKGQNAFLNLIRWAFLARFEQVENRKVQEELDRCGFGTEQQAFVWMWVRKEIDFVQRTSPRNKKGSGTLLGEN